MFDLILIPGNQLHKQHTTPSSYDTHTGKWRVMQPISWKKKLSVKKKGHYSQKTNTMLYKVLQISTML